MVLFRDIEEGNRRAVATKHMASGGYRGDRAGSAPLRGGSRNLRKGVGRGPFPSLLVPFPSFFPLSLPSPSP